MPKVSESIQMWSTLKKVPEKCPCRTIKPSVYIPLHFSHCITVIRHLYLHIFEGCLVEKLENNKR